jgi:hypothetical protein
VDAAVTTTTITITTIGADAISRLHLSFKDSLSGCFFMIVD